MKQVQQPTMAIKNPFHMPLYLQVLIGVIFGGALGVIFQTRPLFLDVRLEHFGQLGILVIKLLRALAAPLIFISIIDTFAKISISKKQGGKLLLICLMNVSVAMVIGLTLMNTIKPGEAWQGKINELKEAIGGGALEHKKSEDPEAPAASLSLIKNISYYVPSTLLRPFFYNNVITIVLLALLSGLAFRRVKDKQLKEGQKSFQSLEQAIETIYQMMVQMLEWIVHTVPYAVFGVVAQVVGSAGLGVFKFLWIFLAIIVLGFLIHSLVYYPLVAWLIGKKSPKVFLGKGADAIFTGLSLNSSLATVPITLKCLTEKMGVSVSSARLSACIGTNLNNDGITLYEAMTALFLTQALGMQLDLSQQSIIVISSIMAGAGVAGIPEAGLIVLPLVLSAAGLPEEMISMSIPLILPVDWILARFRSGVNVMSDMLVAILLDRKFE